MRKSILTLVICAAFHFCSIAQYAGLPDVMQLNLTQVEKRVDEKSDVTGTYFKTENWEMNIDDAKVEMLETPVKEIKKGNIQDLLLAGLEYVQNDEFEYACFRYRIVAEENSDQVLYFYDCSH